MKNLYIFEGFCLLEEIASSCSVILMGNRLPIFEGFLLPVAEVILYFLRKRMVLFLALCRRGFFFCFFVYFLFGGHFKL